MSAWPPRNSQSVTSPLTRWLLTPSPRLLLALCLSNTASALASAVYLLEQGGVLFLTYIYLYLVTLSYALQIEPLFEFLVDLFFWLGALS